METKKIKVLSLFDGIGGAYIALEKAGFEIEKYYSSEIDKNCIKIQDYHYLDKNNFEKIGDVKNVNGVYYEDVDLLVFGSPCTQLSSINSRDRSGLDGADSSLFYEAIRIIEEMRFIKGFDNKFYFLMENVASMRNEERDKITKELKRFFPETKLIKIDSASITSTHRRRYYWTNIPNVTVPEPIDIKFQDVLENGYTDKEKANVILSTNVTLTNGIRRYLNRNIGNIIYKDKDFAMLPKDEKLKKYPQLLNESGYNFKTFSKNNEYDFPNGCYRLPSVVELSRMMSFPDNYLYAVPGVAKTEKQKALGLSFSVDVVAHLLKPLKDIL